MKKEEIMNTILWVIGIILIILLFLRGVGLLDFNSEKEDCEKRCISIMNSCLVDYTKMGSNESYVLIEDYNFCLTKYGDCVARCKLR